jgi:hypothetical protein
VLSAPALAYLRQSVHEALYADLSRYPVASAKSPAPSQSLVSVDVAFMVTPTGHLTDVLVTGAAGLRYDRAAVAALARPP